MRRNFVYDLLSFLSYHHWALLLLSIVVYLLISTSNNHHLRNLFLLLHSHVSKHCSMLLIRLIKVHLGTRERWVLRLYILYFLLIVIATIHNHILNSSLSHFICTCYVSYNSLNTNRLLTVHFFTCISIYTTNIHSFIVWIKLSLRILLLVNFIFWVISFIIILNGEPLCPIIFT